MQQNNVENGLTLMFNSKKNMEAPLLIKNPFELRCFGMSCVLYIQIIVRWNTICRSNFLFVLLH